MPDWRSAPTALVQTPNRRWGLMPDKSCSSPCSSAVHARTWRLDGPLSPSVQLRPPLANRTPASPSTAHLTVGGLDSQPQAKDDHHDEALRCPDPPLLHPGARCPRCKAILCSGKGWDGRDAQFHATTTRPCEKAITLRALNAAHTILMPILTRSRAAPRPCTAQALAGSGHVVAAPGRCGTRLGLGMM